MSEQRRKGRRSVYERYAERARRSHVSTVIDGRVCEVDENGELHPLPPCCPNPLDCTRPQCWRSFGPPPR